MLFWMRVVHHDPPGHSSVTGACPIHSSSDDPSAAYVVSMITVSTGLVTPNVSYDTLFSSSSASISGP